MALAAPVKALSGAYDRAVDAYDKLSKPQQYAVLAAGGAGTLYLLGKLLFRDTSRPSTLGLTGGSIDARKVDAEFKAYSDSFGKGAGEGITDRSKTVQLVDVFYSLVTDIYEWGWGQSFHFSPKLPNKDLKASEAAHEARIAAMLRLVPGQKALDCGCGVGGPMRTIAAVSGAHVTGITINQYQVDRATSHNKRVRRCGVRRLLP
jgi:24-methylenesterol C-methyltransferase